MGRGHRPQATRPRANSGVHGISYGHVPDRAYREIRKSHYAESWTPRAEKLDGVSDSAMGREQG